MYSVVYIVLSFDYNVDFYVKMYAVEDIEFKYINSIKIKIKMAAKFQDVCPKLTNLTYHRFCSE